jgi:hypothetical protein
MSYRKFSVLWLLVILTTPVLCLSACFNPRNTPIFKKLGGDWERENAKYIEEALRTSPVLQDIERLCVKEIPLPEGFRLVSRTGNDKKKNPYLSYKYYSVADYRGIKPLYEKYFAQNGWRVTENREGGWGPPCHAVFRKDSYKVAIQYGGMGDEVNYAFSCQKVFEEDE